jgi:hypothetical protein
MMTHFKFAAQAVSVAAIMSGSAAWADVTAQQVWDDWKANLTVAGEAGVTIGSEAMVDGVLTVTDVAFDITSEDTNVSGNLAWITFTEQGDGTVTVTTAEEYPIVITVPNGDGTSTTINLALRHSSLELLVSGTPDSLTYDMKAKRYAIDLDSINDGSSDIPATASLGMNNLAGTYTVVTSDMRALAYEITSASIDLAANVTNPDDGSVLDLSGEVADFASSVSMLMPLPGNTTPETMMADGLASEGGYTFGETGYDFSMTGPMGDTTGTAEAAGGSFAYVVSSEAFGYSSAVTGIAVNIASPMMPFPVTVSLDDYGLDFLMPMSQTEAPADFALGVNLSALSVNEEVWAMLDPGAILPRDAATVLLDLTGTATLFYDLADPAQAEAIAMAEVPGEINSVSLNALDITFGGAQVTGTGAFTFDNSDMTTIPGMPLPEGKVDVAINGANGLMDKLVQMGLLPGDQVTMARMMMGMFAVPVGDDQLTSTIEVTGGKILANGQPLN